MNKPFASAVLVLALAACSETATPRVEKAADAPTRGPSVPRQTAEQKAAKIAAAKKAMPLAANIQPQTDEAIDLMLGDHKAYHKAIDDFQKAVVAKDTDKVASMVQYPMTIDMNGEKVVIESPARFKQFYGKLITPDSAKLIADSKYEDVMINRHGVLLGDGKTFLSTSCSDAECKKMEVKVSSFQPKKSN